MGSFNGELGGGVVTSCVFAALGDVGEVKICLWVRAAAACL